MKNIKNPFNFQSSFHNFANFSILVEFQHKIPPNSCLLRSLPLTPHIPLNMVKQCLKRIEDFSGSVTYSKRQNKHITLLNILTPRRMDRSRYGMFIWKSRVIYVKLLIFVPAIPSTKNKGICSLPIHKSISLQSKIQWSNLISSRSHFFESTFDGFSYFSQKQVRIMKKCIIYHMIDLKVAI